MVAAILLIAKLVGAIRLLGGDDRTFAHIGHAANIGVRTVGIIPSLLREYPAPVIKTFDHESTAAFVSDAVVLSGEGIPVGL
jgi:hypothetical protein